MKWYVNLLISIIVFFVGTGIAYLTGSYIVLNAVILAFLIQWVAYIPAYTFQTEKFYDLTGTLTYLSVVWFTYMLSNPAGELKIGNLILALLISIWAACWPPPLRRTALFCCPDGWRRRFTGFLKPFLILP